MQEYLNWYFSTGKYFGGTPPWAHLPDGIIGGRRPEMKELPQSTKTPQIETKGKMRYFGMAKILEYLKSRK